ncbi:lipopolysaccharide biosynthesis protein [Bacteroides clarus]|uniref:Sugar transporter n=1 Tax=Bacteroides clarus TaxID=626929 RepID=A0A412N0Z3_9BACE|nr:sugar transporter [Bacteroides clarus]MBS1307061.1 sugar transporter [Bacteroides sp.]RGT31423.1 sugar transporter [Bacteroides clarus]
MSESSRTAKSIKNAKVALIFYFINLVLQFFSRKVFLDYLGAEVLGLNTTAQNLIGFLNLAELGIGGAIAFTLYKPIFEKDTQTINEIVSVQGWLYRRVAYIVIVGACVLMCFFPFIFEKAAVPMWYTYGSFSVLLVSTLLGYFVNYRQIVLTADQKEYKITLNVQGFKIIKVLLQIAAISYLSNGYLYWMILELLMSITTAIILDRLLKREYPWLKTTVDNGGKLRQKYPEIIAKTKQVFFHQMATFVLSQTSPLIIYAYTSLTLVAIYGNYMLIVTGVTLLMDALLRSINAGVGSLVAEGDKQRIKQVFWELSCFRLWLASVVCFGVYKLGHSFITLWVGSGFALEQSAFIVLIAITFINLSRTNDTFLAAYGLYQDVWAPAVETFLNLGLSVLLGYYYGLSGILSGVLISLLVIVYGWKPFFLYKYGFKENVSEYITRFSKYLALIAVSCICISWLDDYLFSNSICSYGKWCLSALRLLTLYSVFSFVLFLCSDKAARSYVKRFKSYVIKRK